MAKYRITSAQRRTYLDEHDRPVDGYHIEFTLLDTMATSYVNIPVAIYSKELRDKMIQGEVKRLEEMSQG